MSYRCTELGINLSREAADFCPAVSATIPVHACGQATAFCPTASAPLQDTQGKVDLEPLRAQLRKALGH
jgi:hypothetical protein